MKSLSLLLLVAAGCGDTTLTPLSQLNLDRPIDVAFGCAGGLRITNGAPSTPGQTVVDLSAQPLGSCDLRSGALDPTTNQAPVPPGQENLVAQGGMPLAATSWYVFILQSVPGTVTLAKFPTQPAAAFASVGVTMIDSDPLTPGVNGISVGEDPVGIVTDKVGCFEVIANAGSCDLSELDVASAVGAGPHALVDRIDVKTANGKLRSRPAAIVAQPPGGTIGAACPQQGSGIVYVAYPSCHTVAAIDAGDGSVIGHIDFTGATASYVADGNLMCPDECGGTGTVTPGTRPVALDIREDPRSHRRTLAIGSDNSAVIQIFDLDATTSLPTAPAPQTPITLADPIGTLGVTSLAVSPQIGMGGSSGQLNDDTASGGQSQFVYAVATDNTVRVADILSIKKECDAQVDPRFLHDNKDVKQMSCMPVGDPTTPPRRPGARGPGIELVGDAIPTSVNIFKVDAHGGGDPAPDNLVGYFAIVTAANGFTYVINVDDDNQADVVDPNNALATMIPLDIAHQLRDALPQRGLLAQAADANGHENFVCDSAGPDPDSGSNFGGPRATTSPALVLPTGTLAAEKASQLPSVRQVECIGSDEPQGKPVSELVFSAPVMPVNVRDAEFPDLRGLRSDETFTLTWQGPLSQDPSSVAIDGPAVRQSQVFIDATDVRIDDQTKPFCDAGVEPFDIVQLRGCDPAQGNNQCPLGYTCFVHPQSQVTGLGACILSTEADRLANACKEYLISERTYTVGKSTSGELTLLPRKHVLDTTPLDGCTGDAQCKLLAKYQLQLASSANPVDDRTPDDTHTWSCALDPARAPLVKFPGLANTGKRCIETCTDDSQCSIGTVCQAGYCMEGIVPPQACVNAPQRYQIQASEAYTVVGTKSGYMHPIVADTAGNCVKDTTAPPSLVGRIPLAPRTSSGDLALCDPAANPSTGQRPDGTFEPDPCQETTDQTELQPSFVPGTCSLASPPTTLVTRQATAIKFRNRGITMRIVDPTYPGDTVCIGDRQGTLVNVPSLPTGTQLAFRLTAGLLPFLLQISPALPIKVVHGPQESIWVIDEGDFLSTSITQNSTRGQVFRIESSSLAVINRME